MRFPIVLLFIASVCHAAEEQPTAEPAPPVPAVQPQTTDGATPREASPAGGTGQAMTLDDRDQQAERVRLLTKTGGWLDAIVRHADPQTRRAKGDRIRMIIQAPVAQHPLGMVIISGLQLEVDSAQGNVLVLKNLPVEQSLGVTGYLHLRDGKPYEVEMVIATPSGDPRTILADVEP